MMQFMKILKHGLTKEAPPFRLVLGLCPSLAVTTGAENGFWMGLAVIFVLAGSEMLISAARHWIPEKARIPVYIVVVATFVTVVDMAMAAYVPEMHALLGIFIPLIVVNCVILGRVEAFASKNGPLNSLADALGVGAGFMASLMAIGGVREILGTANLKMFGVSLFGAGLPFKPAVIMLLPPGAFLLMGGMLAGLAVYEQKQAAKLACKSCNVAEAKEASAQ